MIVDASAIIAILKREPDAAAFTQALLRNRGAKLSGVGYVEGSIIADRDKDPVSIRLYDKLIVDAGIVIEPVTVTQAKLAREAYRDFGKGSGHPARLNLGDCFAYALAKEKGEPLLFKGNDFRLTDIDAAL